MDRENRLKKDRGEGVESSPNVFSMTEMRRPKRGEAPDTPTAPSSHDAFEIGEDSDDDEGEDEEGKKEPKSAKTNEPVPTSPIVTPPRAMSETASTSAQAEDAVPLQLRGMSEKARGKLPEGAFQRQGSTTSLSNHVSGAATPTTGGTGFVATAAWVGTGRFYRMILKLTVPDRDVAPASPPAHDPHSDPTAPARASHSPCPQSQR